MRWSLHALLFALVAGGCDAPAIENSATSLFLFQTRNADGGVLSVNDAPATQLYLEPMQPDAIAGHGDPLTGANGSAALTLGEWAQAGGRVEVRCRGELTQIDATLHGLVPNGVYTSWVIATVIPLRYGDDRQPTYLVARDFLDRRFIVALAPAGLPDGSDSLVRGDAQGGAELHTRVSALVAGQPGCLTQTAHWHLVFDYHADGNTYGALARPESGTTEQAAHLGFLFSGSTPESIPPP